MVVSGENYGIWNHGGGHRIKGGIGSGALRCELGKVCQPKLCWGEIKESGKGLRGEEGW